MFDDASKVIECVSIGSSAEVVAFEVPPNTWHSWVTMIDGSVFFGAKQGPYTALRDRDFAEWSPQEGTPQVGGFVARLRDAKIGERIVPTEIKSIRSRS